MTIATPAAKEQGVMPAGSRLKRVLKRLKEHPEHLWQHVNAQLRLRRKADVALSVLLSGGVRVRGGGPISIGRGVCIFGTVTPVELVAQRPGRIEIGDGSFLNYGVSITAFESVVIGQDCHLGHYAFIFDNDMHDVENKYVLPPSQPVVLEDRVWLGTRAIVMKGVRIGHDSVVGAGSVVTRDVPPRCVVAGTPATIVRRF